MKKQENHMTILDTKAYYKAEKKNGEHIKGTFEGLLANRIVKIESIEIDREVYSIKLNQLRKIIEKNTKGYERLSNKRITHYGMFKTLTEKEHGDSTHCGRIVNRVLSPIPYMEKAEDRLIVEIMDNRDISMTYMRGAKTFQYFIYCLTREEVLHIEIDTNYTHPNYDFLIVTKQNLIPLKA